FYFGNREVSSRPSVRDSDERSPNRMIVPNEIDPVHAGLERSGRKAERRSSHADRKRYLLGRYGDAKPILLIEDTRREHALRELPLLNPHGIHPDVWILPRKLAHLLRWRFGCALPEIQRRASVHKLRHGCQGLRQFSLRQQIHQISSLIDRRTGDYGNGCGLVLDAQGRPQRGTDAHVAPVESSTRSDGASHDSDGLPLQVQQRATGCFGGQWRREMDPLTEHRQIFASGNIDSTNHTGRTLDVEQDQPLAYRDVPRVAKSKRRRIGGVGSYQRPVAG